MKSLFFGSTIDGTDLKWSITLYLLSFALVVIEILHPFNITFRTVLIAGEPILLLIAPILLSFAATNLLVLPARVSRNRLSWVPKTILIVISLGLTIIQVANFQSHLLVLVLSFVVYFLLGHDEDFQNPHIVVNVLVSGIRGIETIFCLIMTCILILDLLK